MNERTIHKIIIGDSRHMEEIANSSVHLVVTSPPYWQLKDYGKDSQVGFYDSYADYINNLNLVWKECHRVLHDGCRMCINIGDQFARAVYYGRYKVIPIRTEIIRFVESLGMDYMGAVIWRKVTTTNTSGGATIMGSFPYPRNGIFKLDYEFILVFKKIGKPPKVAKEKKETSRLTTEQWNRYFSGHWNFPGEKQNGHMAMFPLKLPSRLIKMFSFHGETVLDPFVGSGTTSLAAHQLGRHSVGYEINADFLPTIREKVTGDKLEFAKSSDFVVMKQEYRKYDVARALEQLPYIFSDPVCVTRKMDPRKKSFGSNIDGTKKDNEVYYSVVSVLSPTEVELSGGIRFILAGVRVPGKYAEAAVAFLKKSTKGKKVYFRKDKNDSPSPDAQWGYLFLKNRTHLNAHLIKKGFGKIDETADFSRKRQFLRITVKN